MNMFNITKPVTIVNFKCDTELDMSIKKFIHRIKLYYEIVFVHTELIYIMI